MSWRDNDVSAVTLIWTNQTNHILRVLKTKIHKNTINGHLFKNKTQKGLDFPQTGAIFERSLRMCLISVFTESGFLARTATVARLTMSRPLRT